MLPEDRDAAAVWDIIKAGGLIRDFVEGMDASAFRQDPKTHFAVIAQIQIIGEATKRLSESFRVRHSSIPWREMAGMRDVLIHAYDRTDLDQIWSVAVRDVPELLAYLEPLLPLDDGAEDLHSQ